MWSKASYLEWGWIFSANSSALHKHLPMCSTYMYFLLPLVSSSRHCSIRCAFNWIQRCISVLISSTELIVARRTHRHGELLIPKVETFIRRRRALSIVWSSACIGLPLDLQLLPLLNSPALHVYKSLKTLFSCGWAESRWINMLKRRYIIFQNVRMN